MPKLQTLTRTARGLYTNWNAVNGIPEGGLLEATNIVIDQMGTVSKIRGRKRYGPAAVSFGPAYHIVEYLNRLHLFTATDLHYDSDGAGTWTMIESVYSPDNTRATRNQGVAVKDNLYFCELAGVCRRTALGTGYQHAGEHRGLDIEPSLTGTGAGMFAVDSQVAYRYVYVRKIGTTEYIGAPSMRQIISNIKTTGLAFANSGGVITVTHSAHGYASGNIIEISNSSDVAQVSNGPKTLTGVTTNTYTFAATGAGVGGTLSDGKKFNVSLYIVTKSYHVAAGDIIRVYRTDFSASATTDPGDEQKLLKEYTIVAGDLTTGYVTMTDDVEEAFLGAPLYTNATQEGIQNANDRPPHSYDIALWKDHVWFSRIKYLHYLDIALDSIQGLTDGTSSITIKDLKDSGEATYVFDTAENFTTGHFKRFTGEATQAQNVEKTAKSLCKVINRIPGSTGIEAVYVSQPNERPGKIRLYTRSHYWGPTQIKANNTTTGGKFTPTIPTSYGAVESVNDLNINGLARSKYDQPDAVPITNWDPVGAKNKAILRILPLRDSLIIVKEDGIYRVSGESDGLSGNEFAITVLDPTIQAICPHTWVVLNNAVYGLSTQGVVRVDESGTDLVSQQIEEELKLVLSNQYRDRSNHAAAYESDRKYILYYRDTEGQTATKALAYNYLTNTWTRRNRYITAAHCLSLDDKLYEADQESNWIFQERKTFNADLTDFQDEDATGTLTSNSTTTFEGATVSTVVTSLDATFEAVGSLFVQGALTGHVVAVNAGTCTLDRLLVGLVNGNACTLYRGISSRVRWRPEACQNPAVLKQFPRVSLYFEAINALRHKVSFFSDENRTEEALQDLVVSATLDNPILGVNVPRKFQRARALDLVYEHNRARENFDILNVAYTFRPYGDFVTRSPR